MRSNECKTYIQNVPRKCTSVSSVSKTKVPKALKRKDLNSLTYLKNSKPKALKSCLSAQKQEKLRTKVIFYVTERDHKAHRVAYTNSAHCFVKNNIITNDTNCKMNRNKMLNCATNHISQTKKHHKTNFNKTYMAGDSNFIETKTKILPKKSLSRRITNTIVNKARQLSDPSLRIRRKSDRSQHSLSYLSVMKYQVFKEKLNKKNVKNKILKKNPSHSTMKPELISSYVPQLIKSQSEADNTNRKKYLNRNRIFCTSQSIDLKCRPAKLLSALFYQDFCVTGNKLTLWAKQKKCYEDIFKTSGKYCPVITYSGINGTCAKKSTKRNIQHRYNHRHKRKKQVDKQFPLRPQRVVSNKTHQTHNPDQAQFKRCLSRVHRSHVTVTVLRTEDSFQIKTLEDVKKEKGVTTNLSLGSICRKITKFINTLKNMLVTESEILPTSRKNKTVSYKYSDTANERQDPTINDAQYNMNHWVSTNSISKYKNTDSNKFEKPLIQNNNNRRYKRYDYKQGLEENSFPFLSSILPQNIINGNNVLSNEDCRYAIKHTPEINSNMDRWNENQYNDLTRKGIHCKASKFKKIYNSGSKEVSQNRYYQDNRNNFIDDNFNSPTRIKKNCDVIKTKCASAAKSYVEKMVRGTESSSKHDLVNKKTSFLNELMKTSYSKSLPKTSNKKIQNILHYDFYNGKIDQRKSLLKQVKSKDQLNQTKNSKQLMDNVIQLRPSEINENEYNLKKNKNKKRRFNEGVSNKQSSGSDTCYENFDTKYYRCHDIPDLTSNDFISGDNQNKTQTFKLNAPKSGPKLKSIIAECKKDCSKSELHCDETGRRNRQSKDKSTKYEQFENKIYKLIENKITENVDNTLYKGKRYNVNKTRQFSNQFPEENFKDTNKKRYKHQGVCNVVNKAIQPERSRSATAKQKMNAHTSDVKSKLRHYNVNQYRRAQKKDEEQQFGKGFFKGNEECKKNNCTDRNAGKDGLKTECYQTLENFKKKIIDKQMDPAKTGFKFTKLGKHILIPKYSTLFSKQENENIAKVLKYALHKMDPKELDFEINDNMTKIRLVKDKEKLLEKKLNGKKSEREIKVTNFETYNFKSRYDAYFVEPIYKLFNRNKDEKQTHMMQQNDNKYKKRDNKLKWWQRNEFYRSLLRRKYVGEPPCFLYKQWPRLYLCFVRYCQSLKQTLKFIKIYLLGLSISCWIPFCFLLSFLRFCF